MTKHKKSGSAIFMYCVIAITAITATICFCLYYAEVTKSKAVLWAGVTTFTIMYHLWLRIIMGNVTKLFKIKYTNRWFKEKSFEKKLYSFLKVKQWKDKALTYNPELFSLKNYSLEDVANTMSKAETDHWINEIISLTTLTFAAIWGQLPIFLITAVAAMLFDAQFIVIQRYNRPRILNVLKRKQHTLSK